MITDICRLFASQQFGFDVLPKAKLSEEITAMQLDLYGKETQLRKKFWPKPRGTESQPVAEQMKTTSVEEDAGYLGDCDE